MMMMIGLLYNEAQQDAKVAQTTLTYILTVHRNEEILVPDVSGFRSQTYGLSVQLQTVEIDLLQALSHVAGVVAVLESRRHAVSRRFFLQGLETGRRTSRRVRDRAEVSSNGRSPNKPIQRFS